VLATRLRCLLSGTDVIAVLAGDPAVAVALLTLRPNIWYDCPSAWWTSSMSHPRRAESGSVRRS
jgi:hypothetical protein